MINQARAKLKARLAHLQELAEAYERERAATLQAIEKAAAEGSPRGERIRELLAIARERRDKAHGKKG